ncbi:MAG: hypothetical protein R2873_04445 [Caldilineaceae bacterium]
MRDAFARLNHRAYIGQGFLGAFGRKEIRNTSADHLFGRQAVGARRQLVRIQESSFVIDHKYHSVGRFEQTAKLALAYAQGVHCLGAPDQRRNLLERRGQQ